VSGDIREMHRDPSNAGAVFQVASQFNCLEMAHPDVAPEDGVTRYKDDPTQGPACAIAAGAATVFRNYFLPVGEQLGQTRDRQIDCLREVGLALGNHNGSLWEMRNGYALSTEAGLRRINRALYRMDSLELDHVRSQLRVGVQYGVQVTDADEPYPKVSQVFCSALPVSYCPTASANWEPFATLVLEAAYEATLWAAVKNLRRQGGQDANDVVYLTQLGAGAFGNDPAWVHLALRGALRRFENFRLDVRLVSYGSPDPALEQIASEFQ
jgi:hypothetical protein